MKFHNQVKGKITINIDKVNGKLNSSISFKGLAEDPDVAITSLLINFVSFAIKNGKDPRKIISTNLEPMIKLFTNDASNSLNSEAIPK